MISQNPRISEELAENTPIIIQSLEVGNCVLLKRTNAGHLSLAEYRYHPIRIKHRQELVAMISDSRNEVSCAE